MDVKTSRSPSLPTKKDLVNVHLFNCDRTYKLESVEKLLRDVEANAKCEFSILKQYFPLPKMAETCAELDEYQMDLAVFVVHANESILSINEERTGIGYTKIYRALLQATGRQTVVIVCKDGDWESGQNMLVSPSVEEQARQFEQHVHPDNWIVYSWNEEDENFNTQSHEVDLVKKARNGFEKHPLQAATKSTAAGNRASTESQIVSPGVDFGKEEHSDCPTYRTGGELLRMTVRLDHGAIVETIQKFPDNWEPPPELLRGLKKLIPDKGSVKVEIWEDKEGNHIVQQDGGRFILSRFIFSWFEKHPLQAATKSIAAGNRASTESQNVSPGADVVNYPIFRPSGELLRMTVRLDHGDIVETMQKFPDNWEPPPELIRGIKKLFPDIGSVKVEIWEDKEGNHIIEQESITFKFSRFLNKFFKCVSENKFSF